MNKLLNITVLIVLSVFSVLAQKNGGMWLPTELNEQEMKDLGLKISVKDIFDTTEYKRRYRPIRRRLYG